MRQYDRPSVVSRYSRTWPSIAPWQSADIKTLTRPLTLRPIRYRALLHRRAFSRAGATADGEVLMLGGWGLHLFADRVGQ